MTKEQRAMFDAVQSEVNKAKHKLSEAEDSLTAAAEHCKGTPMEDKLNSIFDEVYDLHYSLIKELTDFELRLNGCGNDTPESWKEAI